MDRIVVLLGFLRPSLWMGGWGSIVLHRALWCLGTDTIETTKTYDACEVYCCVKHRTIIAPSKVVLSTRTTTRARNTPWCKGVMPSTPGKTRIATCLPRSSLTDHHLHHFCTPPTCRIVLDQQTHRAGAHIRLPHLRQLGVDGLEELDRLPRLVGLDEERTKVQLSLGDVIVELEQVPIPELGMEVAGSQVP